MIDYTSRIGSRTLSNIAALGSAAGVYDAFYPTLITGGPYYLWKTGEYSAYVQDSKLYFSADPSKGDVGAWSTPISVNTFYRFLVVYDFTGNDSANPIFYINGTTPTVTEELTPVDLNAHTADIFYVGNYTNLSGSNSTGFNGYQSEVAIYSTIATADRTKLSKVSIKPHAKLFAGCTFYCDMNTVNTGATLTTTGTTLVTASDDVYTWSTIAPAWSKLNAQDGTVVKISKNDDGEACIWGLTTMTLPAGADVVLLTIRLYAQSEDTTDLVPVSLEIDGVWQTNQNASITNTMGYSPFVYFWNTTPYAWTQSTIDNLRVRVTAPATIGKDEEIDLDFIEVIPYYMQPRLREQVGGNHIVGSGALGKSEFFMSYR